MQSDKHEREQKAREVKELYDFVAEQVLAGLFKSDIVDKMIGLGLDKGTATELVEEMEERLANRRKRKVLIITADEKAREKLGRQLASAGYQTLLTATAQDGLKGLDEHMPDLILLDADLEDVPGMELMKKIRDDVIGYKTPVIVLSERKQSADSFAVMGLVEFYAKPVDLERVVQRIKKFLVYPKNPYV